MSRTLAIVAAMHALDGSGFYRFFLPYSHLAENSHHMVGMAPPGGPIFQSMDEVASVDVLVLQRPANKAGVRQMEQLAGKTHVVYETDDDLLQADPSGLPHLIDDRLRESVRRCVRLADLVTVSTPYLAEQIRPYNPRVAVLENHIDAKLLSRSVQWRAELDPDRPVTVGWAGGSSHLIDWMPYADGMRQIMHANPQIAVHFAGYDYTPILGDLRRRASWSGWEQDIGKHYKVVAGFDIGVAPLGNVPFNQSKSHLRALELAACGIPCVATDMEPYREFVVDGVTGFLVRDGEEMATRVHELIHDKAMRVEMGAKAREVAAGWTIQTGWRKWETACEQAVEGD